MSQTRETPESTPTEPAARRSDLAAVLALALPVIVTTVSRTVMGFVDFGMVSLLGTDAQAALTPASMMVFCFISFGIGTMACVTTFASQALGRKTHADASAYAWQAVYLSLGLGLIGLMSWPVAPRLFAWFGHAPAVQQLEVEYFTVCLLSIAPSTAAVGLANFFIGVHRPAAAVYTAVGANLFNIAANYVLIFGGFGLVEPMGIAGAAWGTVLATTFRTVWLALVMTSAPYAREFAPRQTAKPQAAKVRNLLRIGLPASVQFSIDMMGWTLFITWLVAQFGTTHLAATNIVFQYLHVSFMPAVGVGIALNSLVGRALGTGDFAAARRHVRVGAKVNISYMGLMGLAFFLLRTPLVRLFSDDQGIVAVGAELMICAALFQAFDGMCITYNNALRGAGDTLWPAATLAITFWVIGLGRGYTLATLAPQWGSLGPWIGGAAYIIVLGLLLRWRWYSERWRSIDIFQDGHGSEEKSSEETDSAGELAHGRQA